jgi:hypothetical protein
MRQPVDLFMANGSAGRARGIRDIADAVIRRKKM